MIVPGIGRVHYVGRARGFDPSCVQTESASPRNTPLKSNAKITKLDNELTIITENNPNVYSAGINIFNNVGSVYENEENNGATHFLEHMVFRRSKNRTGGKIDEDAADYGASINAETSEEHTVYYTQVLGENIVPPTLIYLDMLLNNRMHQKEFEIEKGAILEEAKGYEDDPEEMVRYLAQETYFKGHPYGKRIIGTQKTISAMQTSDLKKFLNDMYTPDNMYVSLAGNFDTDKVIKEIEAFTSHIKRKAKKQSIPPFTFNVENALESMSVQQAHVVLLTRGYSHFDDKKFLLALLNQAFGSDCSRLFRNIRDKYGYCYEINSGLEHTSFGGTFMVYSALRKDKIQEGIDLILKEMKKVKRSGFKPDEIKRAKRQISTALILKKESTGQISYLNGLNYMYGGSLMSIEEIDRRIKAITNDELIEVAHEVFDPKFIAAYVVGPKRTLPRRVEIDF